PRRLAFDGGVHAPAADPADRPAIAEQQRPVARPGRSRPQTTHDGGQHEWPTFTPQVSCPFQQVAGRQATHKATPLSCRIRHSRGGVIGISTCVTPRWLSASTTALAIAGGAPTVADSPTPLAPNGWCGLGVTVRSVSQ